MFCQKNTPLCLEHMKNALVKLATFYMQESWYGKKLVCTYLHMYNGILLPKLFWPTVRKNCSTVREKLLKFEAEGREFAKFLRSLEQFI